MAVLPFHVLQLAQPDVGIVHQGGRLGGYSFMRHETGGDGHCRGSSSCLSTPRQGATLRH